MFSRRTSQKKLGQELLRLEGEEKAMCTVREQYWLSRLILRARKQTGGYTGLYTRNLS